ncbi:uncharacterized protein [Hemitrygon akajei]|uniref:uncharacterized protein n=1 Tax=Hemitrygon akajei TaxID=2704970 RepID=UPI003BF95D68
MDDSETYMNVEFAKKDARSPSRDGLTCTYSELNFRKDKPLIVKDEDPPIASGPGELPITALTDVLTSTYSELNFRKDKALIDEDEDPPIASGSGELPITAQTDGLTSTYTVLNLPKDELHIDEDEDPPIASGSAETYVTAQEDGLNSSYSLLKLGKTELPIDEDEDPPIAVSPADLSVAAQAGPHKQEPNENSGNRPDRKICLLCLVTFVLFVTVVGLSIHVSQIRQSLKRMQSDLPHQFTEMQTKYRSVNETKAQICELLTRRREQALSQEWIRIEVGCYFISTVEMSYAEAKQNCSNSDSKLLEINSREEENSIHYAFGDPGSSYWIGKCKVGKVASKLVYKKKDGNFECSQCKGKGCKQDQHRFICEKSEPLCSDIPEKIRDLCQQPVGMTSIK